MSFEFLYCGKSFFAQDAGVLELFYLQNCVGVASLTNVTAGRLVILTGFSSREHKLALSASVSVTENHADLKRDINFL